MAEVDRGSPAKGHNAGPYVQAEKEAKSAGRGVWPLGANYRSPRGWSRTNGSWTARLSPVYIDRIFICPPLRSAVMIMNVMDPITVKMISAGMVATARGCTNNCVTGNL